MLGSRRWDGFDKSQKDKFGVIILERKIARSVAERIIGSIQNAREKIKKR